MGSAAPRRFTGGGRGGGRGGDSGGGRPASAPAQRKRKQFKSKQPKAPPIPLDVRAATRGLRSADKHNVLTKVEGMKLREITEGAKYGVQGEGTLTTYYHYTTTPTALPRITAFYCVLLHFTAYFHVL